MSSFILFISLFYAIGLGMLGYGLWSAQRSNAAANWMTTLGTLNSCSIDDKSDPEGGAMYEVKVQYTYTVGHHEYTGSRLAFGYAASSGAEAHQQIYAALKDAKTVTVRYDPSDPETSALSYGIHRSIQFTLAFAITWLAFIVGFTMIWWLASRSDNVLLRNLITH